MDANTLLTTTYAEHIPLCLGPCRLSSISPALDATRWRLSAWSPLRVPTFLALRAQADNCRHLVPRWSHSTAKSIDTIIYKKTPLSEPWLATLPATPRSNHSSTANRRSLQLSYWPFVIGHQTRITLRHAEERCSSRSSVRTQPGIRRQNNHFARAK